jgi:membrane protein DedA with SNARE-associated domain
MEEFINSILAHGLYPAVIVTLIICGMGLPLSEEVVFLLAGYYGRNHGANVWILCASGVLGILLGDSIPYWVGRKYGVAVLKRRPFRWIMSEKGIDRTRGFFGKHGAKAVFVGRFVAGLRMPTFFMSGSMGVGYIKFLLWDLMGALISCPTSIWLAYTFGEKAKEMLEKYKPLMFAVIGLVVLYMIWHIFSHREKRDEVKQMAEAPVSGTVPLDAKMEVPNAE